MVVPLMKLRYPVSHYFELLDQFTFCLLIEFDCFGEPLYQLCFTGLFGVCRCGIASNGRCRCGNQR